MCQQNMDNVGTSHAVMQTDGNFVFYNHDYTQVLWHTHTYYHPGAYLNMQNDGNLVVYDFGNAPLWSLF